MFGPAFLVNPVTQRIYSLPDGKTSKNQEKYIFQNRPTGMISGQAKMIQGGQTIDAAAPIETIPLFIKAGSIVPMGPYLQYATEKAADPVELRIYTGADAEFVLYEDENDNYNYEHGKYSTIAMSWTEAEKDFTIGDRNGDFPGMVKDRIFRVVWVDSKSGKGLEPAKKSQNIHYSGKEIKIKYKI